MSENSPHPVDSAAEEAPGFFHVARKSMGAAFSTAAVSAAAIAAASLGAAYFLGPERVTEFLNPVGQTLSENAGAWLSNAYAQLAATAASIGAIGGLGLGALGGAIGGVNDIRRHYRDVVLPEAEAQAMKIGKVIGGEERERDIVNTITTAAQFYAEQAKKLPPEPPSFEMRRKIAQRNPRYESQLQRDLAAANDNLGRGQG